MSYGPNQMLAKKGYTIEWLRDRMKDKQVHKGYSHQKSFWMAPKSVSWGRGSAIHKSFYSYNYASQIWAKRKEKAFERRDHDQAIEFFVYHEENRIRKKYHGRFVSALGKLNCRLLIQLPLEGQIDPPPSINTIYMEIS